MNFIHLLYYFWYKLYRLGVQANYIIDAIDIRDKLQHLLYYFWYKLRYVGFRRTNLDVKANYMGGKVHFIYNWRDRYKR